MAFINGFGFIFVLVLISHFARCSDDFPSTIDRCKNEDKQCLIKMWNKYIKLTESNDLQELDTPNLHKYFVMKATLAPGSGPLDIVLKMRNFYLTGLDNSVFDKITGFPRDPKEMKKFELIGHSALLGLKGKYNVTGKVLLLPVAGDSDGEVKFFNFSDNIKFNVTAVTSTKMIEGKEYLVISKVYCDYITERNEYQFDDLLNNKEISDSINSILNENQDIINEEVRAPTGRILAEHFKKMLVAAFKKYPYRSYFLDA